MEQEYDRIIKLIRAYNQGSISTEGHRELLSWVSLNKYNLLAFEKMTNADSLKQELEIFNRFDIEKSLTQFHQKHKFDQKHHVKPVGKLWLRIVAVAAAVAAITLSIWLYTSRPDAGQDPESAQYATDIAPGKNTATLTLANGKTITLSDAKTGVIIDAAKLTYNDGTDILSSVNDSIINGRIAGGRHPGEDQNPSTAINTFTASTPRGGTYQITLPDGTKVWLNAASTLRFPSTFAGLSHRKVILNGEAYFEVGKDKMHPFIVESRGQQVEVLGTHFNINAYINEPGIKTTLLEGSVKVISLTNSDISNRIKDNNTITLKPGQQSLLTANNKITINKVDTDLAVAWKNDLFLFENEELGNIMRQVARWYNVEIEYQDNVLHERFGGGVSRFNNVSKVLKSLEATGKVHFRIEGRKIYVSR